MWFKTLTPAYNIFKAKRSEIHTNSQVVSGQEMATMMLLLMDVNNGFTLPSLKTTCDFTHFSFRSWKAIATLFTTWLFLCGSLLQKCQTSKMYLKW